MKIDPDRNPVYVIGFAVVVAGVFTAAIMALHVATEPIVEAHERLLREKALVDLFGLGDVRKLSGTEISELYRRHIRPAVLNPGKATEMNILLAYKGEAPPQEKVDVHDTKDIQGYAFPIGGVGFWAMIEGYLAVKPDLKETLGIVFLRHSETPGLGGRITEPEFRDQFRPETRGGHGLNVTQPKGGEKYVDISQFASGAVDRHVDALSGATGTSTAVGRFLNEDIERFRQAARDAGLIDSAGS